MSICPKGTEVERMSVKDLKVSRRKFLAASSVTAAGIVASSQLSVLNAVASGGHAPVNPADKGVSKHVASSCEMCVNKCGFYAHVVDGRIKKLNPNPDFLRSRGMLCARGNAGAEEPYNPERLKKPLLRKKGTKRGGGQWTEISYEEAFKIIVDNFVEAKEKYKNRSSVAFMSSEGFQEEMFHYLVQSYGSTNTVRHSTLCLSSVIQGFSSVFGTLPDGDLKNAEFVIMYGSNRAEALVTPDSIDFQKNQPKGQQLVVLDPRFTNTASKADKWFPIKPGTDLAFNLALINVIIKENLYDTDFVKNYTYGFDKLAEHVKQYTPEWAEKETEIPADQIRWTAREFAKYSPRAVAYPGRRTSWYVNDVYMRRSAAILSAICGAWDTEGAICPKSSVKIAKPDVTFPFFDTSEGRLDVGSFGAFPNNLPDDARKEDLPLDKVTFVGEKDGSWLRFRDAVLHGKPYPVKSLMMYKQNLVEAVPNRAKTLEMLDKLDFICSIDIQMSDTAWYSDLVLPESTYLERWDSVHKLTGLWPMLTFRQPCVEPVFGTKSMFEITGGILEEMLKRPELWDDADEEDVELFKEEVVEGIFRKPLQEYIKYQVEQYPGAYETLLKTGMFALSDKPTYGKTREPGFRFKTKSGKIELFNLKYEAKGLAPLPVYKRGRQPKPGQYRFILGRHGYNTHSGTQNNEYLWEIEKENSLWVNTKEALKLGVKTGDYVNVKSKVGEQRVMVRITEKIRHDCVFYAHGYGRISAQMSLVYKRGASQAAILEDYIEPISGNTALHETFVTITKA